MTLFLRLVKLIRGVYSSTLETFTEIFPAINERELSPLPAAIGRFDDYINTYRHAAGDTGATSNVTPGTMKKSLHFLGTLLSVLLLSFSISTNAVGQATVTSDKDDYAPRSTAVFTGAGFQPGETVQLKVKNLDRPCNTVSADSSYLPWTVVADDDGGFVTNWTVCDCPGDSLRLKATGISSGLIAYAYFTDANTSLSNPSPVTAAYGSIINVTSTLTQQGASGACGSCVGPNNPIPGKTITFGLNAASIGTGTTGVSGAATFSYSVSLPVNNYTGGTGISATFAGDPSNNPYSGSTNRVNFLVTKATTTVTAISGSGVYGASVTLTATTNLNVAGIAVAFTLDGTSVGSGSTNASGVATLTVVPASIPATVRNAGTHTSKVGASVANTANYSAASGNGNLTISQRPISINVTTGQNKVYGQTDPVFAYTFTATSVSPAEGLAYSDAFSGALTRVTGENVGNYNITQGTVTIKAGATDVSANYSIAYNGTTFAITPLNVSVTVNANQSKIYGDNDPVFTYTSSPAVGSALDNGATISFTGALARAAGENVGSYAINQGDLDNTNYNISFTGANFAITPLNVSVTVNANQSKTYGDNDPVFTYTSSPAVGSTLDNGATISFTGALARAAGENVGSYAINQGDLDNTNYNISFTGANFAITPLNVSVTVNTSQSKIYGSNDPVFTYTSSPAVGSALDNGATISFTGALARAAGENVGSYAINQGDLDNTNYNISFTGANFAITPLNVSVTVNTSQSKTYGDNDPVFTYTSSPAVGSALDNGATISFTGALARAAGENVGSYAINQGDLDNTNYNISFTGANFAITPLNVSVTVNANQSKTYGDNDPVFTYTSSPAVGSALDNGATISFTGALARAAGENVGSYAINQGDLDNTNYNISFTGANFAITPLNVSVTVNANQSKIYGSNDPVFTYTSSPAVGSALDNGTTISFTGALARAAGENVGSYAINQGDLDNTNYNISFTGASFAITPLNVSVTVNANQSKIYGSNDPVFTYTSSPAVGSALDNGATISFTGALARAAGENVGSYAINQGDLDNTNYNISFTGANFAITPLNVSVTVNTSQSKIYGSNDPVFTYTSSPAVGSALDNGATISFTGALARAAGENVGSYAINQGDLDNTNYNISFTGANFTITPLNVSVTVNTSQSKIYGSNDPVFTYTSSPAVGSALDNGATISFTGALARAAGENVGSYAINQGDLDNTNYNISFTGANFAITQLNVSVTATSGQTKMYGSLDPAAFTYTSSPAVGSALANGLTISFTGVLSRAAGENVGSYAIYKNTLANTNYNISYTGANFSITQLNVTVTANTGQTKVYGTSNPASYTYTSNPAVGSSLANGHTISFIGNLSRNAGEDIGLYAITRNTLDNTNYNISYVSKDFEITKATLTVTVAAKVKTYGQVNPVLTGTFTGAIPLDNLTVTYSTTATQYSNVTLTGYPITATINDPNSRLFNYNVINTPNILTITKATPIFTITPYNAMYDGNQHSATGTAIGVDGSSLSGFTFTPAAGYKDVPGGSQSWYFNGGTNYTNGSGNTTVTITPQTANPVGDSYYSGPSFYWTTSATTKTATLALNATIKNNLNYTGDIRTAKISFFIRDGLTLTPISGAQNLPVGLVNPGDLSMGTAALNLQYSVTTHTILKIAVKISGNYTNVGGENTDGLIEVAIPTPGGLIAGCARLCNTNSAGYLKGATTCPTGTVKADLSFFVQYNKSLSNPQGKVYMTIRSYNDKNGNVTNVLHTYNVKSTAISVLATTSPKAQFSGKANLTEIVNGTEVNVEGGAQMQLSLYDGQAPAQNNQADKIGVTIFRTSGGVWYSNNWIGSKTEDAALCGGDVSVTGSGGQTIATPSVVDESTRIDNVAPGTFKVRAFPNPTTHSFTLDVQSSSNEPIEVKVFDLTGHMVYYNIGSLKEAHHKFGQMLTNGTYITEIRQGTNRKTITLIKK